MAHSGHERVHCTCPLLTQKTLGLQCNGHNHYQIRSRHEIETPKLSDDERYTAGDAA